MKYNYDDLNWEEGEDQPRIMVCRVCGMKFMQLVTEGYYKGLMAMDIIPKFNGIDELAVYLTENERMMDVDINDYPAICVIVNDYSKYTKDKDYSDLYHYKVIDDRNLQHVYFTIRINVVGEKHSTLTLHEENKVHIVGEEKEISDNVVPFKKTLH